MTTMRRRKQWLVQRQMQSIRSKQSLFAVWSKFFIEGVRVMVKTIISVFKAFGKLVVGAVNMLKEADKDPVINEHLKKHGIVIPLRADKEKK